MARPVAVLDLHPEEQRELERRVRAATTSRRDCQRARIVLLRAEGVKQRDVAERLGVSVACVNKWSQRFDREGLAGLRDLPGRGRRPTIPLETVEKVVTEAGRTPPGRQRWSTRTLAAAVGIAPSSVGRIWHQQGLKPHRCQDVQTLQRQTVRKQVLGCDRLVPGSAREVRGAVLRRKEPVPGPGAHPARPAARCRTHRTRTHDYIRHGTVCLFAAMSYLEGKLIYRTEARHTHLEWLRFLKQIDREVPNGLQIHIVADNYCTHKHAKVRAWLGKHQRFHMHFTPTSSSWLNLVERFFADLTADCVRDGSFGSVKELTDAITAYLTERNEHPKPYRWKAKGEEILAKIHRARQALEREGC